METSVAQTGIRRWLLADNYHDIGILYLVFGVASGLIGAVLAGLMRLELQAPGLQYSSSAATYNILLAGHEHCMTVFAAVPLLFAGFGHLLLPKWLDTRNLLSVPLSLLAFWLLVCGFLLFFISGFTSLDNSEKTGLGSGWAVYATPSNSLVLLSHKAASSGRAKTCEQR